MTKKGKNFEKYLRSEMMPTLWCPGCGHGNITRGMFEAFDNLNLNLDKTVVVGGIGCSGRAQFYSNTHSMHTTHGRALAFATGIKLSNPELTLVVTMGDGDASAIGGNHFIHACRRDIDMTAIVFNNSIYGMTGGQVAPTTPKNKKSTTTVQGNTDNPFDMVKLAMAGGASFVARSTTFDFQEIPDFITKAINNPGFSVVEILTQCPTYYGKINKLGNGVEMLDYERDMTYPNEEEVDIETFKHSWESMPIGIFREPGKEDYIENFEKHNPKEKQDEIT